VARALARSPADAAITGAGVIGAGVFVVNRAGLG
jgi:hypothetical protein